MRMPSRRVGRMGRVALGAVFGLLVWVGCAQTRNYDDPLGPRFTGGVPPQRAPDQTVRIVSFNLNYARAPARVAALLRDTAALRDADIVLLQEADSASTKWLAAQLGRAYVYVPASWHPVSQRDLGNAILSAWPIVESRKILLPYLGMWRRNRRAAVGATVCIGSTAVRVYAAHLGTFSEIGPLARRQQLEAVLDDAEPFPLAIVGGDFNSGAVAEEALERGYDWPTGGRGLTRSLWAVDHIVVRGVTPLDAGVARIPPGVSDHRPVWTTIRLEDVPPADSCAPP